MTLNDFLLARIAEDGDAARAAAIGASVRQIMEQRSWIDGGRDAPDYVDGLDYALAVLAAVYADHPDYSKSWRP